ESADRRRWGRRQARNSRKRTCGTGNKIPERASDRVPVLRVNAVHSSSSVNGEIGGGSDSGIRHPSTYLPARTRPVAAAPSTCSLRKSLTWNGVVPERHP